MKPLDLRLAPPRGPRETLAGVVFLPRAIDKLHATLPGGDPGAYFPFYGLSTLFSHLTKIDLEELRGVIARAETEEEVVAWAQPHLTPEVVSKTNHVMNGFTQEKIPADFLAVFQSVAAPHLRDRHSNLFDLLEADDEAAFQGVAEG